VILVDTSAWIEFERGTGSAVHKRIATAIERGELLGTTGIVTFEVLAGARDERHARDLRRLLARCRFLRLDEPADEELAASIYRACRQAGTALRHGPDCLIAAVAVRTNARLLHRDADFDAIARYSALLIEPA
jgi:predicted nucleic acid-binding protein